MHSRSLILWSWSFGLLSFLMLFSFGLFYLLWLTDIFNDAIVSNLQLRNGTLSYSLWQRPSVRPVYRIHIFNYSNVENFETEKTMKLNVQEVGPYIYRETLTRINPEIENDVLITYQEVRKYEWEGGSSDDELVTVPNIPLFTAMAFSRDMSFLAQVSLTAVLSTLRAKPFIQMSVGQFLWGYDDQLFRIAKPVMAWQQNLPYEKFGVLAFKTVSSNDRITIDAGTKNILNLGNIISINGKERRNIWQDEECDKIEGSDGSMFPPKLIKNHSYMPKIYVKEMCRYILLKYDSNSHLKGIPTLRYKLHEDIFSSISERNVCFCQKIVNTFGNITRKCPPNGTFNISTCNFGAPMLSSFPHFFGGDKSLLENVHGLNPKEELHGTYIHLHPRLGVPIGGWSRLQINLEARKADAVPFMGRIKDGTILPILWIEVGIDELPNTIINLLYHAFYTVDIVEKCLQWGSLIICVFSVIPLGYFFSKHNSLFFL